MHMPGMLQIGLRIVSWNGQRCTCLLYIDPGWWQWSKSPTLCAALLRQFLAVSLVLVTHTSTTTRALTMLSALQDASSLFTLQDSSREPRTMQIRVLNSRDPNEGLQQMMEA